MAITIVQPSDRSPYLYQFEPNRLLKWRSARGKVLANLDNAKIACIGDSTTMGTGANTTTNLSRSTSYPAAMARVMAARGLVSSAQNFFGSGNVTLTSVDSRVTSSGAASLGAVNTTLGGALLQLTGVGTWTYTPATACTVWDVYSVKTGGTGSFEINRDGGAADATVTGTATPTLVKTTVSGAGTALNMVRTVGTCYVAGVSAYTATKCVEVWNMGASGARAANLATSTLGYSELSSISFYAPNLTVLMIGINDWEASTSVTAWQTSMRAVIEAARVSGDVVLVTPVPTGGTASLNTQKIYVDAMYDLAMYYGIPLVDNWNRWDSYATPNAAGFYFDTLHPAGPGYSDVGMMLGSLLAEI